MSCGSSFSIPPGSLSTSTAVTGSGASYAALVAFLISQPYPPFSRYSVVSAYFRSHLRTGSGPHSEVSRHNPASFAAKSYSYQGLSRMKST